MEFSHILSHVWAKTVKNPDLVYKNSLGSTKVYIFSTINVDVDIS